MGLFLREQHANRAEQLPFIEWETKEGTLALIQDHDTRLKLGKFIGEVSASHWWNHDDLALKLSRVIPAPTGYPREWTLDLLKIACVLRTADAANVDSSRAPGFLWALRKGRISDYSNMHWLFQNRLTLPELRHEALVYASTQDFERAEAKEWWLAFDTLTMVDGELRRSDAVLARHTENQSRLAAKRVANADTPSALTSQVTVRGWSPIDTAFSIDDIPRLVEKLGGEQLYGKTTLAPVRELIQNGMDAVRLRRKVDPGFEAGSVQVKAIETDGEYRLVFVDDGVGLSFDAIVRHLLAFGTSGWLTDPAIGEFTDLYPSSDSVSGQFGIGFFSVFMLAEKVKVASRRFDAGPNDTVILEFENGLKQRPILYLAERQERLPRAGTTIEIILNAKVFSELTVSDDQEQKPGLALLRRTFPTSDVDLDVSFPGSNFIVSGHDWRNEPACDLLKRLSLDLNGEAGKDIVDWEKTAKYLQPVLSDSGEVLGRITGFMIGNRSHKSKFRILDGALVYKGARIANEDFFGVLQGVPVRASRDAGIPTCSPESLRTWFEGQAALVGNDEIGEANELWLGSSLLKIGADSARFPIGRLGDKLVSRAEFEGKVNELGEVKLSFTHSLEQISDVVGLKWVGPALLGIDTSYGLNTPGLLRAGWMSEHQLPEELQPFAKEEIGECSPLIKLACSVLDVQDGVVEVLEKNNSFFERLAKRHAVTDKHDVKHELATVHLTKGMTLEEFNAANPIKSDGSDEV